MSPRQAGKEGGGGEGERHEVREEKEGPRRTEKRETVDQVLRPDSQRGERGE